MASRIRVELDNATGPGFEEIAKGASNAGNSVDKLGDEAKQTASQLDSVKKSGSDSMKSLENIAKLAVSFQTLRSAVQGVTSAVGAMADDGSPAFVRLSDSTKEAYNALLDIGNDPQVQQWVSDISSGISNQLIPSLKSIPDLLFQTQVSIAKTSSSWLEYFRIINKQQREFMDLGLDVAKGARESAKKDIEEKKEATAVGNKLLDMERRIAAEREAATIAAIEDHDTVRTLLRDEIENLKEIERTDSRNVKSKEESLKKIEALRRRGIKLEEEEDGRQAKLREESYRKRVDLEKKFQDSIAENNKLAAENQNAKTQEIIDAATKATDALNKAIAEAKGAKGGNAIEEAKGGLDKRKVLKQVAKDRGDKAEQEAIEQENARGEKEGPYKSEAERQRGEAQRAARIRDARKKAEGSAFKDAARGKVSGEEVDQAQTELISGQAKAAQASGKLGNAAAEGLQQALQTQSEATQLALQQQQQIDQIRAALAEQGTQLKGAANRGRAQRGGLGG